ncbi:URK [Enterospora canceri]|uniref:URK n=1 Tax=Enterospora canceri TaxID=1081671 RepID=A0A1Y1S5J2_9MICR|nr:URK [Enterospora canceri]
MKTFSGVTGITFILIQGATCSGKTTVAEMVLRRIEKRKRVALIPLDDFYARRAFRHLEQRAKDYDFDNPAAFDWESLAECIQGYLNKDEMIKMCSFDFISQKFRVFYVANTQPEIVIVEGLYAFNLFAKYSFDTARMEAWAPPESNPYSLKENEHGFHLCQNTKVLLKMDKSATRALRYKRDTCSRYTRDEHDLFQMDLEERFEKFIWAARNKWVHAPHFEPDIVAENVVQSPSRCAHLVETILEIIDNR